MREHCVADLANRILNSAQQCLDFICGDAYLASLLLVFAGTLQILAIDHS